MNMENKTMHTLKNQENIGTVHIADDVLAMITEVAATEVEGVIAMGSTFSKDIKQMVSMKSTAKRVRVEIEDDTVEIEFALQVVYGYSIPVIAQKVQAKVKTAIENMTGLTVSHIHIRIAGVSVK
ncbi:MAG: Asp23/Gls24 family envelope stress response protein [Lachnospiraceae bacterium]